MFHPDLVQRSISRLEQVFAEGLRGCPLEPHTIPEVDEWNMRLDGAIDAAGELRRPLEQVELAYILNETLLSLANFRYWLSRYAMINIDAVGIRRMTDLKFTQELFLRKLSKIEMDIAQGVREDGLLTSVLKARQGGISTIAECKIAHSLTFIPELKGIAAAAEPDTTDHLWDMMTTALDGQPWWMRVGVVRRNNTFPHRLLLSNKGMLTCAAGRSAAGPSKEETARKKGHIGRGRTTSLLHLSELSSWENPKQIDSALMPQVPENPQVFGVFESTALGSHSWWQAHWQLCKEGIERNVPVFLPWYADPLKYRRRAPEGWQPSSVSTTYAARIKASSSRWMDGVTYSLTKDQLYWYESQRRALEKKDMLSNFLEEFPADDEEAFQESMPSLFSVRTQQAIRDAARPLLSVVEIARVGDLQRVSYDFDGQGSVL